MRITRKAGLAIANVFQRKPLQTLQMERMGVGRFRISDKNLGNRLPTKDKKFASWVAGVLPTLGGATVLSVAMASGLLPVLIPASIVVSWAMHRAINSNRAFQKNFKEQRTISFPLPLSDALTKEAEFRDLEKKVVLDKSEDEIRAEENSELVKDGLRIVVNEYNQTKISGNELDEYFDQFEDVYLEEIEAVLAEAHSLPLQFVNYR